MELAFQVLLQFFGKKSVLTILITVKLLTRHHNPSETYDHASIYTPYDGKY